MAPLIENDALKVFAFDIKLPNESSPRFYIFHDLAELFGEEFNRDALKKLRKLLGNHPQNPGGRLTSNYEADRVSLSASKAEVIFLVAILINDNSLPEFKRTYSEADCDEILAALRTWKRRKPKKWQIGDVFAFPLGNGEFGYGQVLSKDYSAPTCALLECKSDHLLPASALVGARVVSILHLGSDLLDKGTWQVVGSADLLADSDSSQHGKRFGVGSASYGSGRTLQELAEAYFGLSPWNVGYSGDDEYFDKQLMPGIKRPDSCLWLAPDQRKAYRAAHGITAGDPKTG